MPEWFRLLLWPAHLRVDYAPQEFVAATGFGPREMLGVALVLAFALPALALRRREPAVALGAGWMALMLLPVSNLLVVTGVFIAERTLFQPSIGFMLLLGGVAALIARRVPDHWAPMSQPIAIMLIGLLTMLGVARSAGRQRVYHDNFTMAQAAVRDSPRSWRAHADLAGHYIDRGMLPSALEQYHLATGLAPQPWVFRTVFARRLRSVGRDSIALVELRKSLQERPDQPAATAELVAALLAVGRYEEARAVSDEVVRAHGAPPMFVALRQLSDSALRTRAPTGSVRVTIPSAPPGR